MWFREGHIHAVRKKKKKNGGSIVKNFGEKASGSSPYKKKGLKKDLQMLETQIVSHMETEVNGGKSNWNSWTRSQFG